MTDARIARAYPHLSEAMGRVALLGDTLAMLRDMKVTSQQLAVAERGEGRAETVVAGSGVAEEISAAEKTATDTVVQLLAEMSEQDLQAGLERGFLSTDDHREALAAKRRMELSRARPTDRDRERE